MMNFAKYQLCTTGLVTIWILATTASLGFEPFERFQLTVGKTAVLFCDTMSQSWTKDGKPYSAINNSLADISNTNGFTKLKIPKLKFKDAGTYACFNRRFKVEVYESRNLQAKEHELTVHWSQSTRLTCIFTNRDERESTLFVRWYFLAENGKQEELLLPSDRYSIHWNKAKRRSTLIVRNATPSDAGIYKCVGGPLNNIEEAKDKIRLNVTSTEPRIQGVSPHILETYEGTNISFTCSATGFPRPSFRWFKDSNGTAMLVGEGRELKLSSVTKADAGAIVCVATNQNGNATTEGRLLVQDMNDKQVEVIRLNVLSQAIISFQIKYPNVERDRADVTGFVVPNGKRKQSSFPVQFMSNCAVYIRIDFLGFEHAGRYGIIVRDKHTEHVLQESIKRFDIYGPPEAVRMSNVQLSYHHGNLSAIIRMLPHQAQRPVDGVKVQLWQYDQDNSTSIAALSAATINSGNATLITVPLRLPNPNASMALEITAFGPFGNSEPLLKAVAPNYSKSTTVGLDFPQTTVFLKSDVNNEMKMESCLGEEPHQTIDGFLTNRGADSIYVHNLFMKSYVIQPTTDVLRRSNISVNEKNTLATKEGFYMSISFANNTLPEAVKNFQKFRSTTNGLELKEGSCHIKIQYSCIAKYCEHFENQNQPTPLVLTQTEAYTTSGEATSFNQSNWRFLFGALLALLIMFINFPIN